MASRFQVSPYANQQATPGKREAWFSELPIQSSTPDASSGLTSGWNFAIAPSSSKGRLNTLSLDKPGKFAQQPPCFSATTGEVLDLDVSFYAQLAVTSDDSKLSVFRLPPAIAASVEPERLASISLDSAATQIRFHPHASGLAALLSGATVSIFDISKSQPAHTLRGPAKGLWSAAWSTDGRQLATTSKDGNVQLWDPRASAEAVVTAVGHQGIKASRINYVGDQIFSTGFSKMRDREYALRDPRNLDKPIKVNRLDQNGGVLIPLVDHERKIVYLAGRGDMVLRWTELVGSAAVFSAGQAPLPVAINGAAFAPAAGLDVMRAEINRLLISSKEGVVLPVTMAIPRRQYLDFHSELFPARREDVSALDATSWLSGSDEVVRLLPVDPNAKQAAAPPSSTQSASMQSETGLSASPAKPAEPAGTAQQSGLSAGTLSSAAASLSLKESTAPKNTTTIAAPTAASAAASTPAPAKPAVATVTPRANGSASASPTVSRSTQPSTPAKPWSRNFLAGKTPLKPDYDGLSGLAPSSGSDAQSLRANSKFLVFPLAGAGGRLGVHLAGRKGRLPTLIPAVITGQAVHDFVFSPFDEHTLLVAGGDGYVRVFKLPEVGLEEGKDLTEAESSFGGDGMDRILELQCHPTAADLVSTLSDDRGTHTFRVWNVRTGEAVISVPVAGKGVFASAWSLNGCLLALACKDKKLRILDPRTKQIIAEIDSHGSTRPSRPIWLDDARHILTVGFNMSSTRELRVYALQDGTLKRTAVATLDASPAPLVPHHDPDTGILYLFSRGERSVRAYDVSSYSALTLLPSFEHGTLQQAVSFLSKRHCDVKNVEVAVAYRLSPSAIQRIVWTIPRARAEFFQDDVFPPTRDVERPALSASEWLAGEDKVQEQIDLRPANMTPLSQAPATAAVLSTRDKITGPQLTDSQKREQQLDRLFQMARKDTAEDDEQGRPGASATAAANAPDDDDW